METQDVKIDFTRKAMWVLDGHKTSDPIGSTDAYCFYFFPTIVHVMIIIMLALSIIIIIMLLLFSYCSWLDYCYVIIVFLLFVS